MKNLSLAVCLFASLAVSALGYECNVLNCNLCDPDNSTKCIQCNQRYFLNGSSCSSCPDKCLNCTAADNCQLCLQGYVFNSSLNKCIVNGTCQANNCAVCKSEDLTLCETCHPSFYLNSSGVCDSCSPNCLNCTNNTHCLGCSSGFVLSSADQRCYQCNVSNCNSCDSSNVSRCSTCKSGYYLQSQDGTCSACMPNCLECSSHDKCSLCMGNLTFSPLSLRCDGLRGLYASVTSLIILYVLAQLL